MTHRCHRVTSVPNSFIDNDPSFFTRRFVDCESSKVSTPLTPIVIFPWLVVRRMQLATVSAVVYFIWRTEFLTALTFQMLVDTTPLARNWSTLSWTGFENLRTTVVDYKASSCSTLSAVVLVLVLEHWCSNVFLRTMARSRNWSSAYTQPLSFLALLLNHTTPSLPHIQLWSIQTVLSWYVALCVYYH